MEAVAAAAQCSVHSLYGAFGGRDELLRAIFEAYSPILDVEKVVAGPHANLGETVGRIYRLLAEALSRQPRVMPAMLAEALARPTEPALQGLLQHFAPRMLAGLGQRLTEEMAAGRIRTLPLPLLIQQMIAPALTATVQDVVPFPADDPRGAGFTASALPMIFGGIMPAILLLHQVPPHRHGVAVLGKDRADIGARRFLNRVVLTE